MALGSLTLQTILAALFATFAFTTASPAHAATPPATATKSAAPSSTLPPPVDYSKAASWLCRPGHNQACTTDLDATIVKADGSETIEHWHANPNPPIDCFYVYPTVSADDQSNSDLIPAADQEIAMTRQQVARYQSVCRLFVPMYRQSTVTAMRGAVPRGNPKLPYGDVAAAWHYYLEHYNHGRGFVLIGHSQGAFILRQLIRDEVDGKPVQKRLLSAILMGGDVQVLKGRDIGGDFESIPLCHSAHQIGCVIAYSSFRDTNPPDATTIFGRGERDGLQTACTNPAALGGGSGPLDAYLPTNFNSPPYQSQPNQTPQPPWVKGGPPIKTPYVKVPGLLTAECRHDAYATYLGIAVHGDPSTPRVDNIKGDIHIKGVSLGSWGLHLDDPLLPMGNLISIVKQQTQVYLHRHAKPG